MSTVFWGCPMSWHDEIEAGLPAPDGDDPSTLRQDITDELNDHLQCAMNRELLKTPEENAARSGVLSRFGHAPGQLARRLWFDALQETLMSKRLTVAFTIVLTVICLTACGMTWAHSQRLQDMAQLARAEMHAMLESRDAANQKLLDQNRELLEKLALAAESGQEKSLDWNPLKVRIVLDNETQSPGEGFRIGLSGHAHTASEEARLDETSNADGLADFGVVRPGTYELRVTCPWGEWRRLSIQVRPGSDRVVAITAPAKPREPVTVHPAISWPESLAGSELGVLCAMRRMGGTIVGDDMYHDTTERWFLFLQDGRVVEYKYVDVEGRNSSSYLATQSGDDFMSDRVKFYGEPQVYDAGVEWRGTAARVLRRLLVQLPAADAAPPNDGEALPVLSPNPIFEAYARMFSGGRESKAQRNDSVELNIETPEWVIPIPAWQEREAQALLVKSDHPDASPRRVALGAMLFLNGDTDSDGELSEEESTRSFNVHRIKFGEFPVPRESFVNAYLESRATRSSRGSGGYPSR